MATKITDTIYLGSEEDANTFEGAKVCVHEGLPPTGETHWVPILIEARNKLQATADRNLLEAACRIIRYYEQNNLPVLVHCAQGIERSPLTMAYYLAKYHNMTMTKAYQEISKKRPQIQERLHWLPRK